jgi:GAF domain-containing protein
MVNSDAALDLGEAGDVVDLAFKSCLSVPLLAAETLVGVLTLYSTSPAAFSEEQARVLQLLTPSIAATLQAALEFEGRNSGRDATTRPLAVVRGNRPHSEPTRPATGGAGLHVVTRH